MCGARLRDEKKGGKLKGFCPLHGIHPEWRPSRAENFSIYPPLSSSHVVAAEAGSSGVINRTTSAQFGARHQGMLSTNAITYPVLKEAYLGTRAAFPASSGLLPNYSFPRCVPRRCFPARNGAPVTCSSSGASLRFRSLIKFPIKTTFNRTTGRALVGRLQPMGRGRRSMVAGSRVVHPIKLLSVFLNRAAAFRTRARAYQCCPPRPFRASAASAV